MSSVTVELFGKPGCHLCDDARAVINTVLDEFPHATVVERNILDDPEWFESMKNDIPVVMVNGSRHSQWRVDAAELATALKEAGA